MGRQGVLRSGVQSGDAMKRFQFTLDSLLRVRLREKQQAEDALARWNHELAVHQARLANFHNDLRSMLESGRSADTVPHLQRGLAASEYTKRVNSRIQETLAEIQALRPHRDQARQRYHAMAQEVESLESLRREKLDQHRRAAAQQRQEELNDHISHSSWEMHKE